MSLTGNLEDLPLLDILQIVSFSRKTGALSIQTVDGIGGIVFSDGMVVSAFAWDMPPVDARVQALTPEKRAVAIRARIAVALEHLVRLREGQFNFMLAEETPTVVSGRDVGAEALVNGINPQELLLELAKGMDEDRRDSAAAVEASFAEPEEMIGGDVPLAAEPDESDLLDESGVTQPVSIVGADSLLFEPLFTPATEPAPAPEPARPTPTVPPAKSPAEIRTILLVDDEADVRESLSGHFSRGGFVVVEAGDPDDALKQAARLVREAQRFILVTDLGMPTSGGTSFQGGFEVVKRLAKMKVRPPVLMMTESFKPALKLRARQMGISRFVFKPGLSKLNPRQFEADLRAFASKLLSDVLPGLSRQTVQAPPPSQAAAPPSPPETPRPTPTSGEEELTRQFALLQRRLAELRQPQDANQIAVLVMNVAREFFERAILFLVKDEEARGLGGFGAAPRDLSLNLLAREIAIPLTEPSTFQDVVLRGKSFAGPAGQGRWIAHLLGKMGRFRSVDIAILPLVTHRETIALLVGDNPETGRPLGRLDALEMFVNQAGIALENTFLQRKLQNAQPGADA